MYPIAKLDYLKALKVFGDRGYKVVIFFLYDETPETRGYPEELAMRFDRYNENTGQYMAFLTNYVFESSKTSDFIVKEKRRRGYVNDDREEIEQEIQNENITSNPYINMKNVAKAFENGMENRFPCFVILNPNEPDFWVEKKVTNTDASNIFREASHIMTDIDTVDYDIRKYADEYKEPYYYLPAYELLERNLNSIKYGISVNELKEVIQSEKLENYFDLEEIDKLAKNGYIPAQTFFENFYSIKCREIERDNDLEKSKLIALLDKHVSFQSKDNPQKIMLFSVIKNFIELSSIDYLAIAGMFKKGRMKNLAVSPSMVAICLGKVVEDELNLGVFNVFRGAFSITLPDYFNKVQTELNDIEVAFNGCKNKIRFNGRDYANSSKLDYPITSDLRKIAFGNNCLPSDNAGNVFNALRAREDMTKIKKEICGVTDWNNIFAYLKIIAKTRNDAIHFAKPLSKEEVKNSIDAFSSLVKMRFFEVNNQFKIIVRNQ